MAGDVVGRESELAILHRFLDSIPTGPSASLLSGDPGIGKTTVWKEGLAGALERGYRTLSCSPVEAETRLSYTVLGDLVEPVLDESLPTLPEPQRDALEVALLLSPRSGGRADQRAVSLAVLGCIRAVASTTPVVVAIDDAQWMDLPSARVLQFVARRLRDEPIGVLTAVRRSDAEVDPLGVVPAFPEERVHAVHIGPLSVDDIERVVFEAVGERFQRPTLSRIHEMSGGNPFFAQEIALALLRRGDEVGAGGRLPIPDRLQELIEHRLGGLPGETVEALEIVSALSSPTLETVAAAIAPSPIARLDPAIENVVVEVVGDRLRFTHALLASAVYQKIPPATRRELHSRLATIVRDPEERARHLALSVEGPDVAVAAALDEAALLASSRGAPQSAAELWEMARRATPRDRGEDLVRRTHQAGVAHYESGDASLARSVLEQAVDLSMAGPARARVLLDLGMGLAETEGWRSAWAVFEAARGEAGDDLALRALIEQNLGYTWLFRGDLAASERHARAALRLAEEVQEPRVMAEAFQAYPFVEFLLGHGVDQELLDRGIALEGHLEGEFKSHVLRASFVVAQLLKFTDHLDESRRTFTELLGDATAHGVETPIPQIRYHLAELECRSGNWDAAMEHARESRAVAQRHRMGAMLSSEGHFAMGLVEAHLGRADSARREALEGLRVAEAAGEILLLILNLSVLGFLELSLGRPAEADAYLSRAVELERTMGVREPAYFRVVPDEVEALVALGRLDQAEALLAALEEAGKNLDRAWAIATGARCRALVLAARGELGGASAAADEAVLEHDRLPLPFELGRTLLVRGAVERRAKRKREARDTLTKALEIFDGLGAALWADKTRAELARIGGRAPSSLALTPTEARVAELVAAGSTNREAADALFVSVHTVEANLKRIYRKLGIRSRTELASKLPEASES